MIITPSGPNTLVGPVIHGDQRSAYSTTHSLWMLALCHVVLFQLPLATEDDDALIGVVRAFQGQGDLNDVYVQDGVMCLWHRR